jgi:Flp pilus assembly pilin Flp
LTVLIQNLYNNKDASPWGVTELFSPINRSGDGADMSVSKFFKRLWADEEGQSTTEYILILAVVVMIAMKMKATLPSKIEGILTKVMGNIDTVTEMQ